MAAILSANQNMAQACASQPVNGWILKGASQPPRNSAKAIEEYSTKYPATSSDSPSTRSKGERLVSAKPETKKMIAMGNSGITNQMCCCTSTILERLSEPAQSSTLTNTKPIETS